MLTRRDLTLGLSFAMPFLGACPVWLAGNDAIIDRTKDIISAGGRIALGLTERHHGSDLLADECEDYPTAEDQVQLNGEKWLINHTRRGEALVCYVLEGKKGNPRGYSFLFVDKSRLDPQSYTLLPKIKTHGVRGADMGGIQFHKAILPEQNRIGKPGQALEILLKVFQITRTTAPCLALGSTDTALRITTEFALTRKLYGRREFDIPHVKTTLIYAFSDMLLAECCSILALRCLNKTPEKMALYAAISKYLVPTLCESIMKELALILGARYYLREDYYHGIFQKIFRDVPLISFGDGNTMVNLHSLILQLKTVYSRKCDDEQIKRLPELFNLKHSFTQMDFKQLTLACTGGDLIFEGFYYYYQDILKTFTKGNSHCQKLLPKLLEAMKTMEQWITEHENYKPYHEPYEWFEKTKQFCYLHALASSALFWYFNQNMEGIFQCKEIFVLMLFSYFHRAESPPTDIAEKVEQALVTKTKQHGLYSIYPVTVAWTH